MHEVTRDQLEKRLWYVLRRPPFQVYRFALRPASEPLRALAIEWGLSADERGDFLTGPYEIARLMPDDVPATAELSREGAVDRRPVFVAKLVVLAPDERVFRVLYQFEGLDAIAPDLRFAMELNLAGFPGGDPGCYFEDAAGRQLGPTDAELDVPESPALSLVDQTQRLRVRLDVAPAASFWIFPIQTVSQSESGFELVYQCATLIPHWPVATLLAADRHLTIRLDVSDL